MDPLRDMMMNHQLLQSSGPSIVTVEEGMDCREANSRFFSLLNHESRLNIIISKGSTIVSCKLDGHEIVLDNQRQVQQTHETWAIGDRPYQRISLLPWNCHVRGAELLMSVTNGSSSIMYELDRLNELNCFVKLKSIHLQHHVTYFNLNNATEKVPIDGHTLLVQCNGNLNRIQVKDTKLLCQCNKRASLLPTSLIGHIPLELFRNTTEEANLPLNNPSINEDDIIVCDSIFSLESNYPLDVLRVKLQYNQRVLLFELRTSNSTNPTLNATSTTTNTNNQSNVTSTSTTTNKQQSAKNQINNSNDLHHRAYNQSTSGCSSSTSSSGYTTSSELLISGSNDNICGENSFNSSLGASQSSTSLQNECAPPSTVESSSTNYVKIIDSNCQSNNTNQKTTSSQTSNSVLKARVRVSNYGVCIMPIMMTNYACTYRFTW